MRRGPEGADQGRTWKGVGDHRGDPKQGWVRWGLGHEALGADRDLVREGWWDLAGQGSGSMGSAKAHRPRSVSRLGPQHGAVLREGQSGSLCGVGLRGERRGSRDQPPHRHNPS